MGIARVFYPVVGVREPVVEAVGAHGLRHPVGLVVVLHQLLAERLHLHEPGGDRAVDERRVGAPAEGVGVMVDALAREPTRRAQLLDDLLVGRLDVEAGLAVDLSQASSFSMDESSFSIEESSFDVETHLAKLRVADRRDEATIRVDWAAVDYDVIVS